MHPPIRLRVSLPSCLLMALALACSPSTRESSSDSGPSGSADSPAATPATSTPLEAPKPPASNEAPIEASARITPADVFEHERDWPDIVALIEPYTPPGSDGPLKKGYRGALVRVDEQGRARIAFGRHGNHDVPIGSTDLVSRANEVAAGTRHKLGPNFLTHFGAQFLETATDEPKPFAAARLAESERFLCIFADPRAPGFADLARALADLRDVPKLRLLLFPIGTTQDELRVVAGKLSEAGWSDPFGYPGAAEGQARALLGEVPGTPEALLVSAEGRVLGRTPLAAAGALKALREAATR